MLPPARHPVADTSSVADTVGVGLGGIGVAVGGTGVADGDIGVAVGSTGVAVGGTGVAVGKPMKIKSKDFSDAPL